MSTVATKPVHASTDFDRLLKLIGELNYTWTNTESLLVHLIAGMVGTDKETATLIFLTLGTSRSRIALVERLAKMGRLTPERRDEILDIMKTLTKCQKVRNHYNHCLYAFGDDSLPKMTINLRIAESKDSIRLDGYRKLDRRAIEEFEQALTEIRTSNRALWNVIRVNAFPA
ncbi:hypothetical protein FP2506_01215 [Fulvimarina pelagi HTCC2506]|uniref:Uncharacterized protein n=1 Tax=Fulvimarina pelagi HTCC2506 TaxID=314231 RepID=Q0G254_9HYPH|nr:hypothetical protein [Fulvimarina pelagi]EAU41344.1 hypothetical protein FP2506_01215 [Fulvimarina pelagi HTCC2506]